MTLYEDALKIVHACPDSPVRQEFLDLLTEHPDCVNPDYPGAHITASAFVVHPDRRRVLLCLHGRLNQWVQLGGHCEPGDQTVLAAALREGWEESGIDGLIGHPEPLGLDIHPVNCRYGPSRHFDIRFAVLAPEGAVEAVSEESHALGWFTPDALPHPMASATGDMLAPAIRIFS